MDEEGVVGGAGELVPKGKPIDKGLD